MMFEDSFGLKSEADLIKKVVNDSLELNYVTKDLSKTGSYKSTDDIGNWISNKILNSK